MSCNGLDLRRCLGSHPANRAALRVGLLTNQTGVDGGGKRTADVLATELPNAIPGARLLTLFSPEHGILGTEDREGIGGSIDAATRLPVISLYGDKPDDRRPKLEDLRRLDAVVIDLQDAGVRFYTYETVVGYFLEAAAKAGTPVILLDRPALISGVQTGGPVSDAGTESYINYMREPVEHGMTLGELALFINGERHLGTKLTVVPMQGWQRGLWFDQTGVPWVNPSPNLRNENAAALYPGLALLETANLSVGRGTDAPFEQIGAAWIASMPEAERLAASLTARKITGVQFAATSFTPAKAVSIRRAADLWCAPDCDGPAAAGRARARRRTAVCFARAVLHRISVGQGVTHPEQSGHIGPDFGRQRSARDCGWMGG